MNYDRYYTQDLVNGEGLRLTLFVTGCIHACEGCYNQSAWHTKAGKLFTPEIQQEILDKCATHDGLSLSGGDPLHPGNRAGVLELCKAFKAKHPEKDIWLWTGYLFEEVRHLELMAYLDVVIDGKFQKDSPTVKPWRGSDNQRLIRLAELECNL